MIYLSSLCCALPETTRLATMVGLHGDHQLSLYLLPAGKSYTPPSAGSLALLKSGSGLQQRLGSKTTEVICSGLVLAQEVAL